MGSSTTEKIPYKKLTRRAGATFAYHQLWKGPDHLLLVKEIGCTDEYKRFYFRDIQGLIMMRTIAFQVWALVLGIILSMLLAGIIFGEIKEVWGKIFGLLIIPYLIHLRRGPTCKCWIQTGVNKERLVMFKRVRKTRRIWAYLQPDITEAQGTFSLEELEAAATTQPPPPTPETVSPAATMT